MDPCVLQTLTVPEAVLFGQCSDTYLSYLIEKAQAWLIPPDEADHTEVVKACMHELRWIDGLRHAKACKAKCAMWLIMLSCIREAQDHVRQKTPSLFTDASAAMFFNGLYMLGDLFSNTKLDIQQFLDEVASLCMRCKLLKAHPPATTTADSTDIAMRATYISRAPLDSGAQSASSAGQVYDHNDEFDRIQVRIEATRMRNSAHIQRNLRSFVTPENVEEAKQKYVVNKPYMRITACAIRITLFVIDAATMAMSPMPPHQAELTMDPRQRAYALEKDTDA